MHNEDLSCSHGPVSSMPGSQHRLPAGTKCDSHPEVDAVVRIQGETDSFGAEYNCMCQKCHDEYRAHVQAEYEAEKRCDWCGHMEKHVRPYRDMDEGMSGPVYQVCRDCRKAESARLDEELEYLQRLDDHNDW